MILRKDNRQKAALVLCLRKKKNKFILVVTKISFVYFQLSVAFYPLPVILVPADTISDIIIVLFCIPHRINFRCSFSSFPSPPSSAAAAATRARKTSGSNSNLRRPLKTNEHTLPLAEFLNANMTSFGFRNLLLHRCLAQQPTSRVDRSSFISYKTSCVLDKPLNKLPVLFYPYKLLKDADIDKTHVTSD